MACLSHRYQFSYCCVLRLFSQTFVYPAYFGMLARVCTLARDSFICFLCVSNSVECEARRKIRITLDASANGILHIELYRPSPSPSSVLGAGSRGFSSFEFLRFMPKMLHHLQMHARALSPPRLSRFALAHRPAPADWHVVGISVHFIREFSLDRMPFTILNFNYTFVRSWLAVMAWLG